MTVRLILGDRAIRGLLLWLPLAVLIGFLLATNQQDAVRHGLTAGVHGYQGFRYVAFVPWGTIGLFLLFASVDVRCDRLHGTLPLSYRTLWLSRALALVLSAWTLVGAMAVTLLVRNRIQGFEMVGRTRIGSLFAQLLAVSALAVVLARLPHRELQRLEYRAGPVLYLALTWCGLWGVVYMFAGRSPGYALLPGIAAAILGLWIYLSLPAVPTLTAREMQTGAAMGGMAGSRNRSRNQVSALETWFRGAMPGSGRRLVPATIWRTCYGQWSTWILFALLVLLLAMVARSSMGSSLYGLSLFAAFWLVLGVLFGSAVYRLHVLDALPVSRKRIFACTVLPGLLVVTLGYVGATALRTVRLHREPLVDYSQHPVVGDVDVRVPLAYWEIGWRGEPAPLDEPYLPPWEAPYTPWSVRLYQGLPLVLYSPYHVPAGSSTDRVAQKLGRAVEDVYGARISSNELERRYLQAGVQAGEFTLEEDYPGLRPSLWRQTAPLEALLSGLPWLLYLALTVRGSHIRPGSDRKPRAFTALAVLWGASLLGRLWSISAGRTAAWKLNAAYEILLRKVSTALPGGALTWWGLVVILYALVYLWARARFDRVEVPAQSPGSQF